MTSRDVGVLRSTALAALRTFVDRQPDSPYRSFHQWLLDDPESSGRWLQVSGFRTQLKLAATLLDGLIEADEISTVAAHVARYNVYLTQEVVSDNLAIGLANRATADAGAVTRARILSGFNTAMIARLRGSSSVESTAALEAMKPRLASVSLFSQSLAEAEHRALAAQYLLSHPMVAGADIEFTAQPALEANLASCRAVADSVAGLAVADILTEGLIGRYAAVTRLIEDRPDETKHLVCLGTSSILVIPTLAFFAGVLAEVVSPTPELPAVVADGSLAAILTDAAVLLRLLNDAGTRLLEQDPAQRKAFIVTVRTADGHTFGDAIVGLKQLSVTRLTKDLQFGEFNVCLDGIRELAPTADTIAAFEQRLADVTDTYRRTYAELRRGLAHVDRLPGLARVCRTIGRFVEFHRTLYRNSYRSRSGEYGIDGGTE